MPRVPPAPPIFSTTSVWPSVRDIWSPTRRVTTSVGPPAANGTITVIGLFGYCAAAGALCSASARRLPAIRRHMNGMVFLPGRRHRDDGRRAPFAQVRRSTSAWCRGATFCRAEGTGFRSLRTGDRKRAVKPCADAIWIIRSASTLRFHRLEWLHLDPLLGLRQRRLGPDDDRLGHTPPGDGLRVQGGDLATFGMRRVDRDHVQFDRAVDDEKAVDRGEVHAHAAYRTIETGDVEAVVDHRLVRLQGQRLVRSDTELTRSLSGLDGERELSRDFDFALGGIVDVDDGAIPPRCERIAKADVPSQCAQGLRRILEPGRYLLLRIAGTRWRHQRRDHDED